MQVRELTRPRGGDRRWARVEGKVQVRADAGLAQDGGGGEDGGDGLRR